jgi:hypothetical protein
MKRLVMMMLAAGFLGGLVACGSTQPQEVESSLNLPEKPQSTIPAVASIGPTSSTPSTIGGGVRFAPATFPATPDAVTPVTTAP